MGFWKCLHLGYQCSADEVIAFSDFQKRIEAILIANKELRSFLTISYDDFLKQTKDKCDISDFANIVFSYKVLWEKPIISIHGQDYLISSQDLGYACTDGLFSTVTYHEDGIKNHIGKYALEDYLYKIVKESGLYDSVDEGERRKRFRYKGNWNDPADLVFKDESTIVFVESKECVHYRRSWVNDKNAIDKEYQRCLEGVSKFVNLYRKFIEGFYDPFETPSDKNKDAFLIYLTLQYFPYRRDWIIDKVSQNEREKQFLNSHLLIVDFCLFERHFLYKENIIQNIRKHSEKGTLDNFSTKNLTFRDENRIEPFQKFIEDLLDTIEQRISGIAP